MIDYAPSKPDAQNVRLRIMDGHVDIDRWESYEFAADFLTPSDGFSFVIGDSDLPTAQREALRLGGRVRLLIDNVVLADGYIDSIEVSADRSGGTRFSINGRDRLGQALDAIIKPDFQLAADTTLAELLKKCYAQFGWLDDAHFEIDNTANRLATAGDRGGRLAKSKKLYGQELKEYKLHKTKPYNHESVFHFTSRVAQRFGLWIWCSSDGERLIISKPDFQQEPVFALKRKRTGGSNIVSGSVRYDFTDQPTLIIADGFSGGGEFGKGRIKSFIVNPLLGMTEEAEYTDEVKTLLAKYPDAKENTMPIASFSFRAASVPFRPMFLHDDESKTQKQLDAYVKREMSLLVRKALTCHYEVEGHGATVDDAFSAWTVDTIVDVDDEVAGLKERMYVLGVHYSKSRGSGTRTRLDLVRLNSIEF